MSSDDNAALPAPAVPTNWRAELEALAGMECLNEDGAKGDDQYSCNQECVTCCARREVERLSAAPAVRREDVPDGYVTAVLPRAMVERSLAFAERQVATIRDYLANPEELHGRANGCGMSVDGLPVAAAENLVKWEDAANRLRAALPAPRPREEGTNG